MLLWLLTLEYMFRTREFDQKQICNLQIMTALCRLLDVFAFVLLREGIALLDSSSCLVTCEDLAGRC